MNIHVLVDLQNISSLWNNNNINVSLITVVVPSESFSEHCRLLINNTIKRNAISLETKSVPHGS